MKLVPAQLGYRMPAEWERHEATWLSWPRREGISFPDSYDRVMPTFVKMVEALADSEWVRINVGTLEHEAEVRTLLKGVRSDRIQYFQIPAYEPWCRDHGPIFLRREEAPKLAIVDWAYNAWGGKYPPFDDDDKVPTRIGDRFGLQVFHPNMILEGGSIDVNGAGALLTSESCLLNPNRNPSLSREQIEQRLREYLGIFQVIWLEHGIEGDDTDGHIDDISRFISRSTVLTMVEENPEDPNHKPLRRNLEILREVKSNGSPISVITLPMPGRIDRDGLRLPASYANFYIANSVVLLPVFSDPNDAKAIAVLTRAFPDRKIVPIDCRELIWGLGAFHCLTQQQPSVSLV